MRISLDSPLPLPTNFAVETNEARGRLCSVQSKTKREGEGSVCRRGCAAINTRASMRVIRNRIRSAANVGRRFIYGKFIQGWERRARLHFPDTRSHTRDSVHIYTCLGTAAARDLRKYSRAQRRRVKIYPAPSSRIIDPPDEDAD